MQANLISDRPPSISLLRIFGMVLFGYIILGNVVAILVISMLYQGNLFEAVSNPLAHPEIRDILLLAQGLASLVGLVLIPWYYLKSFERRSPFNLFGKFPPGMWIGVLALVTIAFALAISPVTEWNASVKFPSWTGALGEYLTQMEEQAAVLVKLFTSNLTPAVFSLVFVVVAILPAIGEELVFRGLIQTELQRALGNPHAAIWLTGAIFSGFHLQFFGFFPRLLIGVMLGYLYFWSGNLWIPVLTHFLNNGLQLAGLYLYQLEFLSFDVESTESAPWAVVAVSVLIAGSLLFYCKNKLTPQTISDRDIHS